MQPNPSTPIDINVIRWITGGGLGYINMLESVVTTNVSIPVDMIDKLEQIRNRLSVLILRQRVLNGIGPDSPLNP